MTPGYCDYCGECVSHLISIMEGLICSQCLDHIEPRGGTFVIGLDGAMLCTEVGDD